MRSFFPDWRGCLRNIQGHNLRLIADKNRQIDKCCVITHQPASGPAHVYHHAQERFDDRLFTGKTQNSLLSTENNDFQLDIVNEKITVDIGSFEFVNAAKSGLNLTTGETVKPEQFNCSFQRFIQTGVNSKITKA